MEQNQMLKLSVLSKKQGSWTNVLRRALEFVKSRTECYGHTHQKYDHGADRYLDDHLLHFFDERTQIVYLRWSGLLKSRYPKEWQDEWSSAIQGSQQRKNVKALATPRNCSSRGFRLLDLPTEIFTRIFEFAAGGPYELQANLIRLSHHGFPDNNSTQMIFYEPRLWAHLNVFQVCRAFRNLAIEYYGMPQQNSIPFSPKMDTIMVHGERLNGFGYRDAVDGVAFGPNLWLQDWVERHWLLSDGVHSFNRQAAHIRPWNTPMAMTADFLQRPKHITMAIDDGTTYRQRDWEQVWRFLGQTFVNTQCLKLNICHMDACGFT
ncbi:hypothetical protein F5Y05DRAFT_416342 [Hypoxylon sp. FL0543]|nr:hypothetical protein F5Y05DRAFT_416342 [Hypoxylon sp. FL0543]